MQTPRDFTVATPSETLDRGFDYAECLAAGETLSSAAFSVEVKSVDDGAVIDPAPSSRLSGSAAIEDNADGVASAVAVQRFTGMINGNVYRLICRATTSAGQVVEASAHMPCRVAS